MVDEQLRRLAVQHAQTSRLMGVDFVPAYRIRAGDVPKADAEVEIARPEAARPDAGVDLFAAAGPSAASFVVDIPDLGSRPRDPAKVQAALDDLRRRYETDAPHKDFVTKFKNIVFGEGDPCAKLVFVGEAPGEEEDNTGRPFVGRAGQLLDKMIVAMGLSRAQVYICNILKTRPIDNATPTQAETQACKPYLLAQLGILSPDVIVTLGKPASSCLLESTETMTNMRGRWRELRLPYGTPPMRAGGNPIAVMPTFHPAYLLRAYTEENRRKVWSDLQAALERLKS